MRKINKQEHKLCCIAVGDSACGKTAFIEKYILKHKNYKNASFMPTLYDEYYIHLKINDIPLELKIIDTPGQEFFDNMRKISYQHADVIIMIYSCDNLKSLEFLKTDIINEIKNDTKKDIFIVGTKLELFEKKNIEHVSKSKADKVLKMMKGVKHFRCSAYEEDSGNLSGQYKLIEEVFQEVIKRHFEKTEILDKKLTKKLTSQSFETTEEGRKGYYRENEIIQFLKEVVKVIEKEGIKRKGKENKIWIIEDGKGSEQFWKDKIGIKHFLGKDRVLDEGTKRGIWKVRKDVESIECEIILVNPKLILTLE